MLKNIRKNIKFPTQKFLSSINQNEINNFSKVSDWWEQNSSMKPLHAYNYARVNYIKDIMKKQKLDNLDIIDVGCGGGILSESLARLGGNVTAIDATFKSFQQAQEHSKQDKQIQINYIHTTAEEFIENQPQQKFDLVVSMEVIEHVNNQQEFINNLQKLVKDDGFVFISTMNRTFASYFQVILGAEYITGIVPKGTHDWNKFITLEEINKMVRNSGLQIVNQQGFIYESITNKMYQSNCKDINYIIVCQKQ